MKQHGVKPLQTDGQTLLLLTAH